jgi:hypothetical protein
MAAPFHALQMKASDSCKIQVRSCAEIGLPKIHLEKIFDKMYIISSNNWSKGGYHEHQSTAGAA